MKRIVSFQEFLALDIRVGTVISVDDLENARTPAYVLRVDFGTEIGILKSSAQITDLYAPNSLLHKQVVAAVNLGDKQVGKVISQCLVLGLSTVDGVVLIRPDGPVENGTPLS